MKLVCIINPVSGRKKGRDIFAAVKPFIVEAGAQCKEIISSAKDEIYDIAFRLPKDQYDGVILVGGDGTLNEFVNGMFHRKDGLRLPIGLVPAGTGNSMLHDLNLLNPLDAIRSILSGVNRQIDVAKVSYKSDTIYAMNVVGWGLPSTINRLSDQLKIFKGQRYNVASLREIIRNPRWPLEFRLNGEIVKGNYSFLLACNTVHTGNGMKVAPLAQLNDGLFDLVLLRRASRLKLIQLFYKIFRGSHIEDPNVEYHQISQLEVRSDQESVLIIDGQVAGSAPFKIDVLKEELELFN